MSPWAKPQIDAFIRSHAYCPGLDMKDFAREDITEEPLGAWIKLFCTTCETELPIHLSAEKRYWPATKLSSGDRFWPCSSGIREIMRLDQPN